MNIDNPAVNDNRNYDYTLHPGGIRKEFNIITNLVKNGSRVIDLGCGNGTLLQQLQKEKSAITKGLEISDSGANSCRAKGLDVISGRIDEHLPFSDNEFDYAICNVTIQMVMYPEILLSEMKRIARFQIISFPNFAFYRNRIQLAFQGIMPTHMLFDYQWYSTGHIHQLSLKDFKNILSAVGGLRIKELRCVDPDNFFKKIFILRFPNLFMHIPIILLEKQDQ